jgi:hypothetical protein
MKVKYNVEECKKRIQEGNKKQKQKVKKREKGRKANKQHTKNKVRKG